MTNFRKPARMLTSASLALSLLLVPALSFADGDAGIVQLKPLQNYDTGYYGSGYDANNNTGYSSYNTNYNSDSFALRGRVVSIPQGTVLMIRLDQPITSYGTHIGDPISATLENDVFIADAVAIPAGSQVLGQVAQATEAKRMGLHGTVDVRFNTVKLPNGRTIPIRAHVVTTDETGILKGDTYTKDVLKGVGIAAGGTGVGTLMGTAAGSLLGSVGTGALFGLGVGALGGMGYALARKGHDVVIPASSRMSLVIDSPVTVSN